MSMILKIKSCFLILSRWQNITLKIFNHENKIKMPKLNIKPENKKKL